MTTGDNLHCLSCGDTLDQRREHGVTVDYCPSCGGVWLDPGELEQLTGHSSHHHKDRDIDIEEEDEFEEAEEAEEEGILGTIAGALGGGEAEGEFEEEGFEEEGFEEEFGGEEEF